MLKKIMALVLSMVMLFTMVGTVGVSAAADQVMSFDTAYSMMQTMATYLAGQTPVDRDYLYDWVHSYMSTDLGVEGLITLVDDQTAVGSNQVILEYIASFGTSEAEKSNLRFALALSKCIPTASRAQAFSDMKGRVQFAIPVDATEQGAIDRTYQAFLTDEHRAMLNDAEHLIEKNVIMNFLSKFNTTFVITDDINTPADFALYYLHDEFKTKLEDGELKSEYPTVNGVGWTSAEELMETFIASANGSATFNNEKKADFKTVLGIDGIDMYVKREFSMTQTGNLEQVEDETTAINFTASSNITTDDLNNVKWFVDGVEVSSGATFEYTPSAIGSYVVKAQLGAYETTPVTVSVVAAPSYTLNISSSGNLSQDENAETPVVFTPVATPEGADLTQTVWYVNGTATYTGASFSYTPDGPGTYAVHAVLGGAVSEETITITVTPAGYGPVTITSAGSLSQTSGSTSAVVFTAVPDDGVTDVSGARWVINGTDQNVTGATFTFTPSAIGSYVVKAVMPDGSESTNTITVSVTGVVGPGPGTGGGSFYPTEDKEPDYGDISQPIIAPTATDKVDKFYDVEGHWAEPYMEALYELGIFAGTSDTTMNPDWGITRQEVAVLLVRMLGLENEVPNNETYYTDWEDVASWAKTSVGVLSDRGIYVGYGDGSFQPERIISRQELVSVIGRQLSGEYEINLDYVDTHEIYYWAVEHVEELTAFGIVQGFPDGSFQPVIDITRAQAAVIFYNTMYRLGMIRVIL